MMLTNRLRLNHAIFLGGMALTAAPAHAQMGGVTIGAPAPADPSAILDLRSTSRGLLVPRLALVSTTDPIAAPADSLLVWNTSTSGNYPVPGFYFWNGGDWQQLLLEDGDAAVHTLTINDTLLLASAAELNELVGVSGNVEARLSALESTDGNIAVDLSSLEAMDASFAVEIGAHGVEIDANAAAILANGLDIAGLQVAVTGNDSDIAGLQVAVTGNDTDIAGIQVAVGDAQQAADAAQADLDGFADALKNLSAAEISQLEAIDTTTVSSAQWGYLGAADQGLATTDSARFASLVLTGGLTLEGATADDFELSLGLVDPTADHSITFPDASGTVALLSDLTSGDTSLQTQIDTHQSTLTSHDAAIQANDAAIQANTAAIQANDASITALETAVVGHDADIATLQSAISANEATFSTFEASVSGDLLHLQSSISTNGNGIATLSGRTLTAGTGLTGGGDLSGDRSFAIADAGVGTTQLADDAATDAKVVDALTIAGGMIENTPIGDFQPDRLTATDLRAQVSLSLPDEQSPAQPHVGMIRYNSAGYLEFYHEVSSGSFAWVPVNSYAP
ncbi:MAG: hypothetical protein ACLFR7_12520 [Opitutales bacterium]